KTASRVWRIGMKTNYRRMVLALLVCVLFDATFAASFSALSSRAIAKPVVRVGSKVFTEGYVLSEILAQKLEAAGATVHRRFGLGGTGIVYQALQGDQIDVYPEYTGTIK